MVLAAHPPDKFEGVIQNDEGARIIRAKVIHTLGEGKFPKLCTQKFHGLQLGLEFDLHVFG